MKSLLQKLRYRQSIIVVSGLPRSGTSMLMKMLDAGGLDLIYDRHRLADPHNPNGYYEDERVKHLATDTNPDWLKEARGKGIKIVSPLVKYLPNQHHYKVLLIERNLHEMLLSQRRMLQDSGQIDGASDDKMHELFEREQFKVKYLLNHKSNFSGLLLDYHQILHQAALEAQRIASFLAQPLDVDKMVACIDPGLYRNRV